MKTLVQQLNESLLVRTSSDTSAPSADELNDIAKVDDIKGVNKTSSEGGNSNFITMTQLLNYSDKVNEEMKKNESDPADSIANQVDQNKDT